MAFEVEVSYNRPNVAKLIGLLLIKAARKGGFCYYVGDFLGREWQIAPLSGRNDCVAVQSRRSGEILINPSIFAIMGVCLAA